MFVTLYDKVYIYVQCQPVTKSDCVHLCVNMCKKRGGGYICVVSGQSKEPKEKESRYQHIKK